MTQVQHHPEEHQPLKADRGSSANNIPININLGGHTLLILLAVGVVMGIDIAERVFQGREDQRRHETEIQTAQRFHDESQAQEQRHHDQLIAKEQERHDAASKADRDARLVEYYIHEMDGKLIAAGLEKPSQRFDEFKKRYLKEHPQ